jgi:CheY-like chemotaxis protein/DNA-directed RNA polymerase specialized sigma24 family protein
MADLAKEIGRHLPYLRRYARAITGEQGTGDRTVKAALERLLAERPSDLDDNPRLALYRSLHDVLRGGQAAAGGAGEGEHLLANSGILAYRIEHLAPPRRQILVLTALEGFPAEEAARIMRLEPREAQALLEAAKVELRSQRATRILIIEDEPVIALDIATTVERSGHTVVGFATTHKEAVQLAREHEPELILADIQLADDSSGLDAVREILGRADVPVIFVTAFPERLLTGERPEPTFLITKPFDPDTLHVSISQALAMAGAPRPRPAGAQARA